MDIVGGYDRILERNGMFVGSNIVSLGEGFRGLVVSSVNFSVVDGPVRCTGIVVLILRIFNLGALSSV